MNGRVGSLPYTIPVINQFACRAHREEFVSAISKVLPADFKEDINHAKKILTTAEIKSVAREDRYISEKCSEFELPVFNLPTNASHYD